MVATHGLPSAEFTGSVVVGAVVDDDAEDVDDVEVVEELLENRPESRMATMARTTAAATAPLAMPRRRWRWRARAADADVRCRIRCFWRRAFALLFLGKVASLRFAGLSRRSDRPPDVWRDGRGEIVAGNRT